MTITRFALSRLIRHRQLCTAMACIVPLAAAWAIPPAAQQFHQAAQQQQTRDSLQKSQQQQQLRQDVSDNAARPMANNPSMQKQLGQASDAQRDRDRANQQTLLDQQRDADQQRFDTQDAPPTKPRGH